MGPNNAVQHIRPFQTLQMLAIFNSSSVSVSTLFMLRVFSLESGAFIDVTNEGKEQANRTYDHPTAPTHPIPLPPPHLFTHHCHPPRIQRCGSKRLNSMESKMSVQTTSATPLMTSNVPYVAMMSFTSSSQRLTIDRRSCVRMWLSLPSSRLIVTY